MIKNKFKYIDNFPLIIMVIVAILIIILINVYLIFKPYKTIYNNGYLVLSQNMTSNLISDKKGTADFSVGVAQVNYGDSLYKKMDSYYVGVDKKQEVDIDYPIYSSDGLTIYSLNNNFRLINEKFEILDGYSGLYINKGHIYNDSDDTLADDLSYIFYLTDNSIYINTQIITVKTLGNNYKIPVNSPLNLSKNYLSYYTFDGKKFTYNKISDISYDSAISIGNIELTYEEFLLKLNAIRNINTTESGKQTEVGEIETTDESPKRETPEEEFVKPEVSVDNFKSDVYFITANLKINDPKGYITSSPTFEIYDSSDKLYSRKRISTSGEFKISGLRQNEEYEIIGTYKYLNKYGKTMISTFYVGKVKTLSIDYLDEIVLEQELGKRYSNKIEIKNLKITNPDVNAIDGIKRVTLVVWNENDKNSAKTFDMQYTDIRKFLNGDSVTFQSLNSLNSNTVYNYEIKFYDSTDLELKSINNSGIVQTSKQIPTVSYQAKIDNKNGSAKIDVITNNKDDVNIYNYSYRLLDESGNLIDSGMLDYKNNKVNSLDFVKLNYGTNYKLIVEGEYDLLDGNGPALLESEKMFTIAPITSNIVAWYENPDVTSDSLKADIYMSSTLNYLSRPDTLVSVYLLDSEDNPILDSDGNKRYIKEYKDLVLSSRGYNISDVLFEELKPDTQYKLGLEIKIDQIGEDIIISKILTPSITTEPIDAYVNVVYKKLLGNTLDASLEVIDYNNKIGKDNTKDVIVEVYEGKYDTYEINKPWVYRKIFNIIDDNNIKLTLENYNFDNYTIVVKSDFYDGRSIQKYIDVKNNDSYDETIIVDKNMFVKSELQEQLYINKNSNYLQTSINAYYNELTSNLYIVDCVSNSCSILGYISPEKSFTQAEKNNDVIVNYLGSENGLNKSSILINNKKIDVEHNIYFVIEKPFVELKNESNIELDDLESKTYIMNYLSYNTGYEIYNIDDAKDFFDTSLIKTVGETKHYVVTNSLDFNDINDGYLIGTAEIKFNGSIDFQGYSVELYRLSNNSASNYSNVHLFKELQKQGILKNAVLNYHLDYDGNIGEPFGFVVNNLGTIENIIVNIYQKSANSKSYGIGSLAYENSGTIRKFAVYLRSDFHTYKTSYLVNYKNSGTIEDGFVTYYPDSASNYKVLLYDNNSTHGTFSASNSGTIKNCYNLLDIVSGDESPKSIGIYTITNENSQKAKVKNTISVAKTTTLNNYTTGPNVPDGNIENISNNYYVDLGDLSANYGNKFNKKINKSVLRNKQLWNFIINENSAFSIINGYYPLIDMNLFMNDYQPLISIEYDFKKSQLDILSAKEISSDIENNEYIAEVLINNPTNVNIDSIAINNLSAEILSQTYDSDNLLTTVILKLSLESNDVAQSSYYITKLNYSSKESSYKGFISYDESNPRRLDINVYRLVNNYEELINAINNNENIYLIDNVEVLDSDIDESGNIVNLPSDTSSYTSMLNGNEKYIDFKDYNIKRGYFIRSLNGNLYNLGIKNLTIRAGIQESYLGFVKEANSSVIENVDISKMNIIIDRQGTNNTNKVYIGLLASMTSRSDLSRISVNDSSISKPSDYKGIIYGNYIGGIIGYASSSSIKNSYVYNLNVSNLKQDTEVHIPTFGGIVGYASSSTISSCYSHGSIETGYRNVGGILGYNYYSQINNNYSVMDISSSNDYIAGIVGNHHLGVNITNNLFIGELYNENFNENFYSISDNFSGKNYVYEKIANDSEKVLVTTSLLDFDNNNSFTQNNSSEFSLEGMPYLKESSFAEQKISKKLFNPSEKIQEPTVEYIIDDACLSKIDKKFIEDSQYQNACATSAILTFEDGTEIIENDGFNDDNTLIIEKVNENKYKVTPNLLYFNSYELKLKKGELVTNRKVYLPFYLKVYNVSDWNSLKLTSSQNVILLEDVTIEPDKVNESSGETEYNISSVYKDINNLLGNDKTISITNGKVSYPIIRKITKIMRDVNFKNIKIVKRGNTNYAGIITNNSGTITNCSFENISIESGANQVGMVGMSNGYINNVHLKNISVIASSYVGGLVGYDSGNDTNIHISNIYAQNVFVSGKIYVGGIAGNISYPIQNISSTNSIVIGNGDYVGGLVGKGNVSNSSISNSKIYAQGTYVGGAGGYSSSKVENLNVENVQISDDYSTIAYSDFDDDNEIQKYFKETIQALYLKNSNSKSSRLVGGIYGYTYSVSKSQAKNIILANKNDLEEYTALNAENVGGIVGGYINNIKTNLVEDSIIYAKNNVGGIVGISSFTISQNAVIGSQIEAKGSNAGGIIGKHGSVTYGEPVISTNQVMSSNIKSAENSGGIVGYIEDISVYSQKIRMVFNMAFDSNISGTNAGGIIGNLYKVPDQATFSFFRGVFYGTVENSQPVSDDVHPLIGKIQNFATLGYYIDSQDIESFVEKIQYVEYVGGNSESLQGYQINSLEKLKEVLPVTATLWRYPTGENGINYFPVLNALDISKEDYIEIPTGLLTRSKKRMVKNNSNVNISYNLYSSDVDKINIEFSEIDSNSQFYYEIGEYKSSLIPINKNTYTIYYDYKTPIKIHLEQGVNYKEKTYKSSDLSRVITLVGDKTYYIDSKTLYGEAKAIMGSFVNLYDNKALTSNGKIYNIETKEETDTTHSYELLDEAKPLYKFSYNNNSISTYYNYSLINDEKKDYQIIIKNGKLNIIDNNLNNKKNSYIIDNYNDSEYQVVLQNTNSLYSLKNDIKKTDDFKNSDIEDMYTDIYGRNNLVVIKYSNGEIYTFDYRTGKKIFSNFSEDVSLLEYLYKKITNSGSQSEIPSASFDKYQEIEILKKKIEEISPEEASQKISNDNSSVTSGKKKYISVYNTVTSDYDIYSVDDLLTSQELESENNKIYKDYELVRFYRNSTGRNQKFSLNGIITFGLSILAILSTLYLLVNRKRKARGVA